MKTFILIATLLADLSASALLSVDTYYTFKKSQPGDTAQVLDLISQYEELKYDEPDEAANHLKQALKLALDVSFEKGIIKSKLALGSMLETTSHYDSALSYFEQTLELAQEINYRKGVLDALAGKGKTLRSMTRWDEAIHTLKQCIELADVTQGDSSVVAQCYNHLGNIYLDQHHFEKALDNYQRSLALTEGVGRMNAILNLNIGLVHFRLNDFDKALSYFMECLKIAQSLNDEFVVAHTYQRIGLIKKNTNAYDEARKYYNLAIEKFQEINDRSMVAYLFENIGNIYFEQENYAEALDYYEKSLKIQNEINDKVGLCYTLIDLGTVLFKLKEYQKAENYLLQARELSTEIGVQLIRRDAAMRLSELFAEQKNFKKAYLYQVELKQLDDTIFNENKSSQIAEMETKYQSEQKEKEISLLNAENQIAQLKIEKQNNIRNYLIVIALIMLLMIALVYNRYQIKVRANGKLKELDQLKTNFFTNISHEFRTPLTLILSPVDRMISEVDSEKNLKDLGLIRKNAHRLLELINQLLDLSKLEVGKLELKVSKSDINQEIRSIAASFESMAVQKGIDYKVNVSEDTCIMYLDTDKVQKIISNLLSNAFKFSDENDSVTIGTFPENKSYVISVKDSGSGISDEDQKRLFHRFSQLSQDEKNLHKGTGIGLALAKELVELHHGTIELYSELGKGSEFTIRLPMDDKQYIHDELLVQTEIIHEYKKSPLPTIQVSSINEPQKEKGLPIVLVVEDNKDLRLHISSILDHTYEIHEAENGKLGLEKALKLIPDVIVSDLMMPELDGKALCDSIKSDEKTSHIPVILLTAKADLESKLESLEKGADDYLTKPFDAKELEVRIQNLIEQRAKLRAKYSEKVTIEPSKVEVEPPEETFIRKAISIVDINISNADFNVELFQKEMGMSRMQLHRKLKALTNHSTSEFVRIIRLERAAALLKVNGVNVAEAAYQSGFNSLSYFNQCFKEKYGVSPSKYASVSA